MVIQVISKVDKVHLTSSKDSEGNRIVSEHFQRSANKNLNPSEDYQSFSVIAEDHPKLAEGFQTFLEINFFKYFQKCIGIPNILDLQPTYSSVHVIILVWCNFGINKKLHSPYGLVQVCEPLKNLLVLIYPKLHLKSCDYLY